MDPNVFRILLGSSSGGLDPQVVRFNWSPVNLTVRGEEFYLGTNGVDDSLWEPDSPSSVIRYNPYNASITWARYFYASTTPSGFGGYIGQIHTSASMQTVDLISGTYRNQESNLYRFSRTNGIVNARKFFGYVGNEVSTPIGQDDNYYLSGYVYAVKYPNPPYQDATGLQTQLLIYNKTTDSILRVQERSRANTNPTVLNTTNVAKDGYYTRIYPGFTDPASTYLYTTKFFAYAINYSQGWHPTRYALQRVTLSTGAITNLRFFGSSSNESVGKYDPGPLVGVGGSHLYVGKATYVSPGYEYSYDQIAGTVSKFQASNGAYVWGRDVMYVKPWGYAFRLIGAFCKYDDEENCAYLLTNAAKRPRELGSGPTKPYIIKIDANGNLLWQRYLAGSDIYAHSLEFYEDKIVLSGTCSGTDGGFGPGCIWILPKDGSMTGSFGSTSWNESTDFYLSTALTPGDMGSSGPPEYTQLGTDVIAPTDATYSSSANTSATNGYIIPI